MRSVTELEKQCVVLRNRGGREEGRMEESGESGTSALRLVGSK